MSIKDILMYDETLFRNMQVFNPDFIPENFNYRKEQMDAMAYAIRPVFKQSKPNNLLILGPCATGKTTSIKKVFEEVEGFTDKIKCVYINCQLNSRKFSIISEIYKQVTGVRPPSSGVSFIDTYDRLMGDLNKKNKSLIIALDDANLLFSSSELQDLLYMLLRAHEKFPSVYIGVFVILSDVEFRLKLDSKTQTLFLPTELTFTQYTYEETFNILKDRVKAGFYPRIMSDDLIDIITEYTLDNGDLRTGINLLREAGEIAESKASKKITKTHIEKAINSHVSESFKDNIETLNEDELFVLKTIFDEVDKLENNEILRSVDLIKIIKRSSDISYANATKIINKLEFLRFIDTKKTGNAKYGKTKLIYPRFKVEDFRKIVTI